MRRRVSYAARAREARPANVVTDAQVESEDRMQGAEEASAGERMVLGPLCPKKGVCRRWTFWVRVWVFLGAVAVVVLAAAMVPATGRTATRTARLTFVRVCIRSHRARVAS